MAVSIIQYGKRDRMTLRRILRYVIPTVAATGIFVLFSYVPVKRVEGSVDAVTGSLSSKTTWFGILRFGPTVTSSPLEIRAKSMGLNLRADWRRVSDCEYFTLGTSRGCDLMPPVFRMGSWMKPFVQKASDAEVRTFLQIMQTGTDAQQKAAVEGAVTQYFDSAS